jgi:dienelactone hydrolase
MLVDLVTVMTTDNVRLDGMLVRPPAGSRPALGFDAAILHHGVGGNFYNSNFFEHVTEQLVDRGVAVLRVNNRGHDLMYNSPTGRLGAAFEKLDDAQRDWTAWLDFATAQGFERVAVVGHSLGAVKTILYGAGTPDPRVVSLVAVSPPRFCYSEYARLDTSGRFKGYYDKAQAMVDAGDADGLLAVDIPTSVVLAAKTYVDKYGPHERFDILRHLPNVSLPILVTIGSEEGKGPTASDWYPFGGLATKVASLAEGQSNVSFRLIDGADHMYSTRAPELWTAIDELAGR